MKLITRFMIIFGLLVLSVSAYAQDTDLNIVASHSILADVIQNVSGDLNTVTSLLPVSADPHSFQPSPSDLITVASADMVFVNGALFEETLLDAIENAGEGNTLINVSSCVEIIPIGVTHDHHDHGDEDHEHGDEDHDHSDEDHDEHGDENHNLDDLCDEHSVQLDGVAIEGSLGRLFEIDCTEDHSEGGCDPHVWLNPENVMLWTLLIRDELIEADPDNAEFYISNANKYVEQLSELDLEITNLVDSLPQDARILVTNHDSMGYLAHRFGFEIIGTVIPSGSTVAEPSAQAIAQLIDVIRAEAVPAIFSETTVNDTIIRTVADETGAEIVLLYSGSLGAEDSPASTYLDYIRYNYTAIVEALYSQ